jgi:predicted ATP-dependent protease
MPGKNEKDLVDVPAELRKGIKIVPVREVAEVFAAALSPLVLARPDAVPGEARKARVREAGTRRRDRIKPRAIAQGRRPQR